MRFSTTKAISERERKREKEGERLRREGGSYLSLRKPKNLAAHSNPDINIRY
jgi:hypothetical protein